MVATKPLDFGKREFLRIWASDFETALLANRSVAVLFLVFSSFIRGIVVEKFITLALGQALGLEFMEEVLKTQR